MFYLTDLAQKEVFNNNVRCGENPNLHYDNLTKKCAIEIDDKLYTTDKITVEKTVVANFVEIPRTLSFEEAICPFGEIYVGQRVYNLNGKYLGEVENAELTPKLVLKKIWTKDTEFLRGQIFSVGDVVVIKAKTYKALFRQHHAKTLNATRKKASAPPKNRQAITQNTIASPNPAVPQLRPATTEQIQHTGQIPKRYGNFNFLLGKVVDKNIVNFQGEIMIKKAEKVTREVLRQAKISGKLIELYLHVE